jgi:uncharacterized membrane protein AbrB (regulator of aidB expression)
MVYEIVDMFVKWLIIFVTLIVAIGIPAYLIYILSQYKNNYKYKNDILADKVEELEIRVKELEMKNK